jgi:hypothetical protein
MKVVYAHGVLKPVDRREMAGVVEGEVLELAVIGRTFPDIRPPSGTRIVLRTLGGAAAFVAVVGTIEAVLDWGISQVTPAGTQAFSLLLANLSLFVLVAVQNGRPEGSHR